MCHVAAAKLRSQQLMGNVLLWMFESTEIWSESMQLALP